jgi:hypothetical protein
MTERSRRESRLAILRRGYSREKRLAYTLLYPGPVNPITQIPAFYNFASTSITFYNLLIPSPFLHFQITQMRSRFNANI